MLELFLGEEDGWEEVGEGDDGGKWGGGGDDDAGGERVEEVGVDEGAEFGGEGEEGGEVDLEGSVMEAYVRWKGWDGMVCYVGKCCSRLLTCKRNSRCMGCACCS